MIIKPKVRGFICTTTHPVGCEQNVLEQIEATRARNLDKSAGPKKVLVIGASSGYGLSARITAAFGYGADTLGVFFEKPGTEKKPGTAGWYNAAAFDKFAKQEGLYSKSINGDALSHEAREKAIELIKQDMGQVDLVVYSLASPVRKLPDSGEMKRSSLKPIGETYRATAIDTNGAGDLFAGAFLYAITHGHDFPTAGKLAATAASQLVSEFGPRLSADAHTQIRQAVLGQ